MGGITVEQLYDGTYSVGALFQENRYQKIYMGESIKDSDCIVVICEFNKSDLIDEPFIHTLRNNLQHLLHFEENESTAVFVTEYGEGMSLFQVIDNYPNTAHFRMNLLHDYLNDLRRFDPLLPVFQYILASDSQFSLKDGDLAHSELVIIDEDRFDPTIGFDQVKHRISQFAHRVLDFKPEEQDRSIVVTLRGFFEDLETDLSLGSLEKIYQAYRKIYIYDMYLDKDDSVPLPPVVPVIHPEVDKSEPVVTVSEPEPKRKKPTLPFKDNKILLFNKERYAINPLYVALIVIAIGIALFAIFLPMINKISDTDIPVAAFEKEKIDDHWKFKNLSKTFGSDNKITEVEWEVYSNDTLYDTYDTHNLNLYFNTEGIYRISLRVMDKFGNWSEPYSEEIYFTPLDLGPIDGDGDTASDTVTESLNSYAISFEGTPTFDSEEVRSGDTSIKMVFDGDQTHGIVLERLFMDNNTRISLWLKTTEKASLTVSAIGLNGNESLFSQAKVIRPDAGQWEKVEFNIDTNYADTLKLFINGENLTLWIDDIEINSYK